jgi:putative transposase
MARREAPVVPDELLDRLLAGRDPQAALGKDGLVDEPKRARAERAPNAETDHHLGGAAAEGRANGRNGYGRKTLLTDSGKLGISAPRDRLATFDPQLVAEHRRRLPGFDDKIVPLHARGMTVRGIQGHLAEPCGLGVSPELVSRALQGPPGRRRGPAADPPGQPATPTPVPRPWRPPPRANGASSTRRSPCPGGGAGRR